MKKEIFKGFGCKLFKKGNKYFAEYDAGGVAVNIKEVEITKQEMEKFKKSEKDAYEVLLKAQQRGNSNQNKSK